MTNTEQALPDHFTFVTENDIHYTATRKGATYEIREEGIDSICCDYLIGTVEFHIKWKHWVITSPKQETSLLSRIKAFTEATNSSVFIHDGFYEVYYNGVDAPAKAETDEDLEKLMKAVVTLYEATRG